MAEPSGALTGLEEEDFVQPITYPLYQLQSQTPSGDLSDLQNTYGTAAMPIFNWVRSIQTGTGTYTPSDPMDQSMLEKYKELVANSGVPAGLASPEQLTMGQVAGDIAGQVAIQAGGQIGASLVDPYIQQEGQSALLEGLVDTFGSTPTQLVDTAMGKGYKLLDAEKIKGDLVFQPELTSRATAEATGNLDLYNKLNQEKSSSFFDLLSPKQQLPAGVYDQSVLTAAKQSAKGNLFADPITAATPPPTFGSRFVDRLDYTTDIGKANLARAGGSALVNFGVQLATGRDPVKAARSAGAQAIGTYIGNALLPGIGGFVGGTLGTIVGGRVICNELMRQGIMSRKQVVLDYKFTRDYLTPMHVNGYHIWAVWMVKQMRKGRLVNFWKHVAGHRANEIAYIYGEREKPDYLGKIYRKILEPMCLAIGSFCNKTDWSTLYKHKEI